MSNQIQLQNQNQLQVATNEAAKTKAIEYLSSMGLNLPQGQKEQFIELCQLLNLNPFLREIYAVGYKDKFNIIIGYNAYLKRAEMTGLLGYWNHWTEGSGKILAMNFYHRFHIVSGPFRHEVYLAEYKQDTQIWRSKPITMIKKVAVAQGFRLAFPTEFGSMPYIQEEYDPEMDQPQPQADPKSLAELKSALEPLGVKLELKGTTAKASGAVFNNSTALKSLGFVFDKAQGAWLHNNVVSDDIVEAVVEEKPAGFESFDKLEGYINTCGLKISEVKESANGIYFAKLEVVPGMEADAGKLPEGAIQKGGFFVLNVDTLYRAHIGNSQAAEALF